MGFYTFSYSDAEWEARGWPWGGMVREIRVSAIVAKPGITELFRKVFMGVDWGVSSPAILQY